MLRSLKSFILVIFFSAFFSLGLAPKLYAATTAETLIADSLSYQGCDLGLAKKFSYDRYFAVESLHRLIMTNTAETRPDYEVVSQERMAISQFLISDKLAFELIVKWYQYVESVKEGGKQDSKLNKTLANSLVSHVKFKIKMSNRTKETLATLLDPNSDWKARQTYWGYLKRINTPNETIVNADELSTPKEFSRIDGAPATVSAHVGIVNRFVVRVKDRDYAFGLIQLPNLLYVSMEHAWSFFETIAEGSEIQLFERSEDGLRPVFYRIVKRGTGVVDENLGPEQLNSNALNDLIVFKIIETQGFNEPPKLSNNHEGTLHFISYPKPHVFFYKIPSKSEPNAPAYSSGHFVRTSNGLLVADFVSHTSASGFPVFNSNGEVIGITWGNRSFRRNENLSNIWQKLYFGQRLLVEREYPYIIPIDAVLQFTEEIP